MSSCSSSVIVFCWLKSSTVVSVVFCDMFFCLPGGCLFFFFGKCFFFGGNNLLGARVLTTVEDFFVFVLFQ